MRPVKDLKPESHDLLSIRHVLGLSPDLRAQEGRAVSHARPLCLRCVQSTTKQTLMTIELLLTFRYILRSAGVFPERSGFDRRYTTSGTYHE